MPPAPMAATISYGPSRVPDASGIVERMPILPHPLAAAPRIGGDVLPVRHQRQSGAFAEMLLESEPRIADATTTDQVLAAARLMRRYADTPMDYADATL